MDLWFYGFEFDYLNKRFGLNGCLTRTVVDGWTPLNVKLFTTLHLPLQTLVTNPDVFLFNAKTKKAAWVKLNRLRTGVGRFHSSMHKWGLAPSPNCECGASEQTADHVLTMCPIHRAPHGARGLTVLDDETRCWLNNIAASI